MSASTARLTAAALAGRLAGAASRIAHRLPLLKIGIGNCNGGTEGAVAGTVIGTYPHGPILARNPALADHVLELALGHELPPLVSPEIDKLRRQRLARVRRSMRIAGPAPERKPDNSLVGVDDSKAR